MSELENVNYVLISPIDDGKGGKITMLTFREATAEDACNSDLVKGDMNQALAMMSGMCGVTLPVLKKLKVRDLKGITTAISSLMGNEDTEAASG